jgi:hypothetical protein
MADYLDYRQATDLAAELAGYGGRLSVVPRVETMERKCRLAARLIRAMLRQVNSSDNWRLPDEA